MSRKLRFEALYPYSPEQVWTALTDSAAIADWLMPNDFRPVVGHRFNFTTKPAPGFDGVVHCEVLAVEEPLHLAYSWRGGGIDTVVSYRLAREGDSTRLVMEQDGFRGIKGFMVSRILGSGWKKIIGENLRRASGRVQGAAYAPDPSPPAADCH
jgi:uncharacterized protein YndB with AHSA1/START domain